MVGAEAVDVGDGLVDVVHDFDGQDGVQIFGGPIVLRGGNTVDDGPGPFVPPKLHALFPQGSGTGGQEAFSDVPVHQQGFRGVADGQGLGLGVHRHLDGHVHVGGGVHVGVAQALRVAHDGDAGVVHDVADEGVAAPGDDQIDAVVLGQHVVHIVPGFQQGGPAVGQDARRPLRHGGKQGAVGAQGLPPALEQGGVPALQAQGGDLHQSVGPGFKNHPDDADGAADPVQVQPRGQFPGQKRSVQGVRQGEERLDARQHVPQFLFVKF